VGLCQNDVFQEGVGCVNVQRGRQEGDRWYRNPNASRDCEGKQDKKLPFIRCCLAGKDGLRRRGGKGLVGD